MKEQKTMNSLNNQEKTEKLLYIAALVLAECYLLVSVFRHFVPAYDRLIAVLQWYSLILALSALLYWFFGTELGCSLRSTGANEAMSRAQGINTKMAKILGLMISNGIVALSSAMLAHYQGFVDVNMGRGAIVIGLAAVIISEVVFGRLFTNFALKLVGVALGAVIYYIVIQIVLWLGLNTNLLKLLSALIVAVFLGIPYWKAAVAARNAGNAGNAGKRGQEHA